MIVLHHTYNNFVVGPHYYWQNRSGRITPVPRAEHFARMRQASRYYSAIDRSLGLRVWYEGGLL